jgi:hypothetical protein
MKKHEPRHHPVQMALAKDRIHLPKRSKWRCYRLPDPQVALPRPGDMAAYKRQRLQEHGVLNEEARPFMEDLVVQPPACDQARRRCLPRL